MDQATTEPAPVAGLEQYPKMKPEAKARWLEALRSGKYKQGQGWLMSKRRKSEVMGLWADTEALENTVLTPVFCCLGVLCDLHDASRWNTSDGTRVGLAYKNGEVPSRGYAPDDVMAEAFVEGVEPDVLRTVQTRLAQMNDKRLSFTEIADWIEARL